MPSNILIAIAWPYSNAEIHVGNITGSHLPGGRRKAASLANPSWCAPARREIWIYSHHTFL